MNGVLAGGRAPIRAAAAVAIVGMSCRFPGASDTAGFWKLLAEGEHAIGAAPPERGLGPRHGGYLSAVDDFDAGFFGISPREAALMDPQQRLILELGWQAFDDAGIAPHRLAGTRTGVFVGAMSSDYATLVREFGDQAVTAHTLTGLNRAVIANRLAHFLQLSGPSLTVDTAQSSSLVAVQLAFESLRRGECELAVAGGVNLNLAPGTIAETEKFGALSPDHRCFTFDARANGYVRGEGAGVVILKPATRAVADGDRIYAVILGGATNSGSAASLSDPSVAAQEDVLRAAYADAGMGPAEVDYVELHGTATRAGDPVEAAALGAVSGTGRAAGEQLLVGSVKTNIGHLEGAAGIAGLIKVALSLDHGQIPPSLNFEIPNPDIPFSELGLRVLSEAIDWPGEPASRLAGVSSFGMGGTNCHLVVSAVPPSWTSNSPVDVCPDGVDTERQRTVPWIVSGATGSALRVQAERLADHGSLDERDHPPGDGAHSGIAEVGHALVTSRSLLGHRAAVVAENRADLVAGLRKIAAARWTGSWPSSSPGKVPNGSVWDAICTLPSRPTRRHSTRSVPSRTNNSAAP
ncbi:MAG: beta-ketoacyl synthase N-terminal-like domain-containing protein [Frankia sp.]